MQIAEITRNRNESIECLRMLAMFLVVCIHYSFPGGFGQAVSSLGRFAVPLFFAISGYFSYNLRPKKIAKRFWHLVKLVVIASITIILCVAIETACRGGNVWEKMLSMIPSARDIGRWVFLQVNAFSGHLWYLSAAALCYAILWIYVSFFGKDRIDYRPLYIVGMALLGIQFAVGDWVLLYVDHIPLYCFRNGWFLGLPMFSMGVFLREYQQRIFENYQLNVRKILFVFLGASVLVLIQWKAYGNRELPLGSVIQAAALILLAQCFPVFSGNSQFLKKVISTFGFLSLSIYILHMNLQNIYAAFFSQGMRTLIGAQAEAWLHPVILYVGTMIISLAAWAIIQYCKWMKIKWSSKNT